MTDLHTTRITTRSERGASLALKRLSRVASNELEHPGEPVILAHGTFSNHRTCGGLARYLAGRGYDCWLFDYEGHGDSNKVHPPADFETMFLTGSQSALRYVSNATGQKVHWIGHSGGGLAALMSIAREPKLAGKFQSLVTLASQASDAGQLPSHRLALRAFTLLTRLLGRVPAKALKLGPDDENAEVMQQWYAWNLTARWLGADGFDYSQSLTELNELESLPVLSLAGAGDWFIAPTAACRQLFERLPSKHKSWLECGVQQGYSENYSHARLVSSRPSAREIWPRIGDWLAEHPSTSSADL